MTEKGEINFDSFDFLIILILKKKILHTDQQTDRHADQQTDQQTDIWPYRSNLPSPKN